MLPSVTLTVPAKLHTQLRHHLFCGDGRESAAIVLCSRTPPPRRRFLVKHVLFVPNEACTLRRPDAITWPGEYVERAIDIAEAEGLAIFLMHSHPGNMLEFSLADDRSDRVVIPTLFHAVGDTHGTAIMVPDGTIKARIYDQSMKCESVDLVSIPGANLMFWWDGEERSVTHPRPTAFTSEMTRELGRLSAAVIGVSGTGSPVAEQVARLGFGEVILVDPDKVEHRNLNRIVNSTLQDADEGILKVEMFGRSIERHRGPGIAVPIAASILTRPAVLAVSQCDVIFCCTDTVEARYVADLLCSAFLIPVFDVGVVIPSRQLDDEIAVIGAFGRIDYVYPGGSSLQDRKVYTPEALEAEYLQKNAPTEHKERVKAGYLPGTNEEAPAVITLNMYAAAKCLSEFVNRAYSFGEPNRNFSRILFNVGDREQDNFNENSFDASQSTLLANGDAEPLLGLPKLKLPRAERKK